MFKHYFNRNVYFFVIIFKCLYKIVDIYHQILHLFLGILVLYKSIHYILINFFTESKIINKFIIKNSKISLINDILKLFIIINYDKQLTLDIIIKISISLYEYSITFFMFDVIVSKKLYLAIEFSPQI